MCSPPRLRRFHGVSCWPRFLQLWVWETIGFSVARPDQAEAPMAIESVSVRLAQASPSTVSEKDTIHGVLSDYYDTRDSTAASTPALIVIPNQVVALSTALTLRPFLISLWRVVKAVDIHILSWRTIASKRR